MHPKNRESIAGVATCVRMDDACPRYIEPEAWPPKSPGLNPMYFFVWGELERLGYRGMKICDLDHLKERLQLCWAQITRARSPRPSRRSRNAFRGVLVAASSTGSSDEVKGMTR